MYEAAKIARLPPAGRSCKNHFMWPFQKLFRRTPRALFICGCGHSGTSLVANMFAAHPEVFIPLKETNTFLDAKRREKRLATYWREFRESGRKFAAEKTPSHINHLDTIRRMVPNARFLILVRDGRDVAASHIKRVGSAQSGIDRWISENTIVLAERASPDVMVIRYEDLIETPEAVLEEVCRFAEIPFSEQMLHFHEQKNLWFDETEIKPGSGKDGAEHIALRNWQINQPIFDGRGQWHGKLTAEDVAAFNTGSGRDLMAAFGYAIEPA